MFRFLVFTALLVFLPGFAEPTENNPPQPQQPFQAKDLTVLSQEVNNDLKDKLANLRPDQKHRIYRQYIETKRVLDEVLPNRPFKYTLTDQMLKVYDLQGKLLQNWNHHDKMEIRGDIMALLDSGKEFRALRSDGVVLVTQWRDTVAYYLYDDYIGLLDSKGIFESFSTRENKKLIQNWRDTVTVIAMPYYIALLDTSGNLNGYTVDGNRVLQVRRVKSVRALDYRSIEYVTLDDQTLNFQIVQ